MSVSLIKFRIQELPSISKTALSLFLIFSFCINSLTWAATTTNVIVHDAKNPASPLDEKAHKMESVQSLKERLKSMTRSSRISTSDSLVFDLPVTYNRQVSQWITFYQVKGKRWFPNWLQRSYRYMPFIQRELKAAGLPTDLAYMVMIESGFSFNATSVADAVGPWQFIESTGSRYGLQKSWWLDERRDLMKSTRAAIRYLKDLHEEFGSWYLVAASYNMGENGLRRQIKKHGTKDYWTLIKRNAIPKETQDYVPKILAAMLIAKAPNLYGFRGLEEMDEFSYDVVVVPGGTDLEQLADHLGVTRKALKDLNAELVLGYIPRQVTKHLIRVPKGASRMVASWVNDKRTIAFE